MFFFVITNSPSFRYYTYYTKIDKKRYKNKPILTSNPFAELNIKKIIAKL